MENKKIKILYIVTQTFWGGVHKYIFDLATNLDNNKYDITVAAGNGGSNEFLEKLSKYPHIKLKNFKYLKRPIKLLSDLLAIFEIAFFIKKNNFDIVHLNSSKAGVLGSIGAKIAGCLKVIYTAHGFVFNEPLGFFRKKLYIFLEKYSSFFKDKIITVSKYDYKSALKYKIVNKNKLIIIHNGSKDLDFLNKQNALNEINKVFSLNLKLEDKIIGSIALFYKTKGLIYLIQAANIILKKYPKLKFIVLGDGEERKNLEKEIKKYNLASNFLLPGKIINAFKYFKIFDIFVLPSIKEGFGYVLLEASLSEIPIIASRVGGIPDIIIEKETGFLCEPQKPEEMAQKMIYVIENSIVSKNISKSAKQRAENEFSFKKMLDKTLNVYEM